MTMRDPSLSAAENARFDVGLWLNRHSALMVAATACAVATHRGESVALAAAISFAILVYQSRASLLALTPCGGYANWLTGARLVLLLLAAVSMDRVPREVLLGVFAANVVVDMADGYVARRTGQVTQLGVVLDRETDALFVLVAYLYFFLKEGVAPWILVPGLLPYGYRLLALTRPAPPAPDRKERLARPLAGANYAVLLVAIAAAPDAARYVLLLSASLVASSFFVSFWNLYRNAYPIR
jgi:hypothetical protein